MEKTKVKLLIGLIVTCAIVIFVTTFILIDFYKTNKRQNEVLKAMNTIEGIYKVNSDTEGILREKKSINIINNI